MGNRIDHTRPLDSAVESGYKVDFQARGIENDGWGDQDLVWFSKSKGQRVLLHELAVFFCTFPTHRGSCIECREIEEDKIMDMQNKISWPFYGPCGTCFYMSFSVRLLPLYMPVSNFGFRAEYSFDPTTFNYTSCVLQ